MNQKARQNGIGINLGLTQKVGQNGTGNRRHRLQTTIHPGVMPPPPYDRTRHIAFAQVYKDMQSEGIEPNVIMLSSLIWAAAKAGHMEEAFEVFNELLAKGLEPNEYTYSALSAACACRSDHVHALQTFTRMLKTGPKPNRWVYNFLISACAKGGEWEMALMLYKQVRITAQHWTVGPPPYPSLPPAIPPSAAVHCFPLLPLFITSATHAHSPARSHEQLGLQNSGVRKLHQNGWLGVASTRLPQHTAFPAPCGRTQYWMSYVSGYEHVVGLSIG